jgi:PQQ-dependent catabolism-associated CXXCW motif protein
MRYLNSLLTAALRVLAPTARALVYAALLVANCAYAQKSPGPDGFADENRDWAVESTNRLRQPPYHAPTPLTIPGAKVVQTRELRAMAANAGGTPGGGLILIDVLTEEGHVTLAGAVWVSGAGRGTSFVDQVQSILIQLLDKLTGGDKARPMVFFCASSQCWLSYNAALRAVAAGYQNVYWYRGGVEAWVAAGLPTAKTSGGAASR